MRRLLFVGVDKYFALACLLLLLASSTLRAGNAASGDLTIAAKVDLAVAQTTTRNNPSNDVVHQLRIYQIFDGNKKAFHERFRDHAMRIMARYGVNIVATWESHYGGRTEFIYLLEWPDKETMKNQWAKFMADKEWIDIKKKTGEVNGPLVGEIEDRTLEATDYSPRRRLTK
jgi:NIPSNAP